ncbi:hypothetical protein P872_24145 [Rhodonellum psychrophilum GCM71 = DSM 17998]|uniref:Uncharacterized protein n=1 Tax=Rhodonellum psychrophilum GCM71 = DSM 17998 TaxID=1123057 RepID=U5C436_9BACT|nr:hypothetical protein P872_24145 [Rhodonellum psychrophilum GCM71 = DSM 17998]
MDLRLHHSIYKKVKTKQIGFDGWLKEMGYCKGFMRKNVFIFPP